MVATLAVAKQSVTTQRVAAGGRHLPGLQPSEEGPSFSAGVGFKFYFFLLIVRALILDQPGPRLDRKCFMLVQIIALSFPTHKIAFLIRWGTYLLRQSLSRQSDGNSFN